MATNPSSLAFNGLNRHAKLSTNASIKNMTNFTWIGTVKVGDLAKTPYQPLWVERQGTGTGKRFAVHAYHNRLRFELSVQDGRTDTNYDYKYDWDDRWHQIAFVARITGANPTYEIYFDSVQVAKGTLVKPAGVDNVSNTTPLGGSIYVGNHSLHTSGGDVFPSDRYWDGKLDEVLLFNAAKSQSDIQTYFTSKDTWNMSDTDMFSYWRFDENTGTSTTDSDNPSWTGTTYVSNVASSALWSTDRPWLGNGANDTTAPTTPTLPGSPTTSITSDGFTANWNATTDNIFVQYYELHVSTGSGFSSYTSYQMPSALTKKVTGLLPNTNYYWRISALDAAGNRSGYTATQSLTTSVAADLVAPNPPTALSASSITYSSFAISWTHSGSADKAGYKVDVALDPGFTNYLANYRNIDVGNVTTTNISGTSQLTTYYIRLRTYDTSGNESVETSTLVVQTPSIPDLIAPSPNATNPPTSIASKAFTANWEVGEDNIGVVGYYIDLSTASDFSSFVTTSERTWNNYFVGNVTSLRINYLLPSTTYYYRVRAIDAAGNISGNMAAGEPVTLLPTSIEDGGFINTIVEPNDDAMINSAATSTNYGSATSITVVGNGASNTQAALLEFPLTAISGTIMSAVLNLYVTEASLQPITVQIGTTPFDQSTVTWATAPAVSGGTLTFTPLNVNQWVAVDISSLLLSGATTYVVKLTTNSTDGFTFDTKEGTNRPYIDLDHDPTTATKLDVATTVNQTMGRINYCTNPNFEANVTTGWTVLGSGITLSVNATTGVDSSKALQVVSTGAATNSGTQFGSLASTPLVQNETVTISGIISATSSALLNIRIEERNSAGTLLTQSSDSQVTANTVSQLFTKTYKATNATCAWVNVMVFRVSATAYTAYLDNILIEKLGWYGGYFDGNTSSGSWVGTANLSWSKLPTAAVQFSTAYLGDSDADNSVVTQFKKSSDTTWIQVPDFAATVNRTTKVWTSALLQSEGNYNYVVNPSFEVNTTNWLTIPGAGTATLNRVGTYYDVGEWSGEVTVSAVVDIGVSTAKMFIPSVEAYHARARIYASAGNAVKMVIRAYNSAGSVLGTSPAVVGVNSIIGNDGWQDVTLVYTVPASTVQVDVAFLNVNATAQTFRVDSVLLGRGSYVNPYRDGSFADALWTGVAHQNPTTLILLPNTSYDIQHIYTDPDGIVDNIGLTTIPNGLTWVSPFMPDNVTTAGTLTVTPSQTSLDVLMTYTGDDDNDMTAIVEWKRTDLTNWSTVVSAIDRVNKRITAVVPYLIPGTSYTIRVTFTDADGVYNTSGGSVSVLSTTLLSQPGVDTISKIMFSGFILMDGSDYSSTVGVTSHDAFGFPDRRVQVEDLPRQDGAVELQNLWGKRPIQMSGFIEGNTRAELETNLQAMKRAFAKRLQPLVINTLGNQGRFYYATCDSLATVENPENLRHLTWDATFVCADPFAYDLTLTSLPEFNAVNAGSVTINNYGDLDTDLRMNIRTLHTFPVTLTVVNNTTGERITPAKTLITGDRFVIDSSQKGVVKNGVDIDYQGGFPRLAVGGNNFSFYLTSTSGSPSILIELLWRQRYL